MFKPFNIWSRIRLLYIDQPSDAFTVDFQPIRIEICQKMGQVVRAHPPSISSPLLDAIICVYKY